MLDSINQVAISLEQIDDKLSQLEIVLDKILLTIGR